MTTKELFLFTPSRLRLLTEEEWERLYEYQEASCPGCGLIFTGEYKKFLEIDHIIPKSAGGDSTPENYQLLCVICNRRKGKLDIPNEEIKNVLSRAERKSLGLCERCDSEAVEGKTRCRPCLDKASAQVKARNARRRAEGVCTNCLSPALPSRSLCARHFVDKQERTARANSKGGGSA